MGRREHHPLCTCLMLNFMSATQILSAFFSLSYNHSTIMCPKQGPIPNYSSLLQRDIKQYLIQVKWCFSKPLQWQPRNIRLSDTASGYAIRTTVCKGLGPWQLWKWEGRNIYHCAHVSGWSLWLRRKPLVHVIRFSTSEQFCIQPNRLFLNMILI